MRNDRTAGIDTLQRPGGEVQPPTHSTGERGAGVLEHLWSRRIVGLAVVAGLAAAAALLSAWLTPRGPVTAAQVLVWMPLAVGVGVLCGLVMGNRWSMLVTPLLFIGVFEIARIETVGATVDAIHLTMLGMFAFVAGRLAHGSMVLLPMALGAGYGVWLAHRLGHPTAPRPGIPGRIITAMTTLAVVALAVALTLPGSTAPILGADGQPLPGSIAELATVTIGGHDQTIMIRGRSVDNPVLLHLAGGPGGTDLGAMRADTSLEEEFVVATWDQRGTGKSYPALDPVDTLTVEQAVADTIEVANHLRDRFDEQRIYLTANSWGTIPSVQAVQQRPELFHAYIGTGQMVNNRETDRMFYEDTLAWADATGNDGLVERMRANGPPPYREISKYEHTVSYEHQWNAYPGDEDLWEMPFNTFVAENNLLDRINALRGFFDVNTVIYPQLQDYDFRREAGTLDVPVYLVIGRHEARGRAVLANEWFDQLDAPAKQRVVFERSGHRPSFEQPADFSALMSEIVADTYAAPGAP